MDFNATIDLIIKDLKEASDIIDDLKRYPGVPALQVELAKLKCRSAGECIAILKTLKEPSAFVEQEPVVQEKVREESVKQEKVQKEPARQVKVKQENLIEEMPQRQPEAVEEKEVQELLIIQPADEKTKDPVPQVSVYPPVVKATEHKKIPVREPETPILADRFSNVTNTFHDKLGVVNSEEDLTIILQSQPIDSLPGAIGINDKFLFIREIFKGNQADYLQAIARLESAENITDAKAVIMSYTGENDESDAVKQLLELVKRKLPANE
jgi:hypothetical protein